MGLPGLFVAVAIGITSDGPLNGVFDETAYRVLPSGVIAIW